MVLAHRSQDLQYLSKFVLMCKNLAILSCKSETCCPLHHSHGFVYNKCIDIINITGLERLLVLSHTAKGYNILTWSKCKVCYNVHAVLSRKVWIKFPFYGPDSVLIRREDQLTDLLLIGAKRVNDNCVRSVSAEQTCTEPAPLYGSLGVKLTLLSIYTLWFNLNRRRWIPFLVFLGDQIGLWGRQV